MLDGAVDDVLSLSHIDAPRAYGGIVLASVGEPYDVHSRPIKKMALILTQAILQVTQKCSSRIDCGVIHAEGSVERDVRNTFR